METHIKEKLLEIGYFETVKATWDRRSQGGAPQLKYHQWWKIMTTKQAWKSKDTLVRSRFYNQYRLDFKLLNRIRSIRCYKSWDYNFCVQGRQDQKAPNRQPGDSKVPTWRTGTPKAPN